MGECEVWWGSKSPRSYWSPSTSPTFRCTALLLSSKLAWLGLGGVAWEWPVVFVAVFLPVMLTLRLQMACFYISSPVTGTGYRKCFGTSCANSPGAQCYFWESTVGGGGLTLECWDKVARLHDSAFFRAMEFAKTQLSPLFAQSLFCFLPWSLGSAACNMLIIEARLFRVSKSQRTTM